MRKTDAAPGLLRSAYIGCSFMFRALYEEGDASKNSEKDNIPEYLQIRGYELIKGECRNEIFKEPGKYGVINEE